MQQQNANTPFQDFIILMKQFIPSRKRKAQKKLYHIICEDLSGPFSLQLKMFEIYLTHPLAQSLYSLRLLLTNNPYTQHTDSFYQSISSRSCITQGCFVSSAQPYPMTSTNHPHTKLLKSVLGPEPRAPPEEHEHRTPSLTPHTRGPCLSTDRSNPRPCVYQPDSTP
jgi:hypothetical protein